MTAFVPIPARKAAELVSAAGIPDAHHLLIDSAAAGLVKAYALAIEVVGKERPVRGAAVSAELWHRMIAAGAADDLWSGGTVRLAGSDLIGGEPTVHVTGIGFGEQSLGHFIGSHAGDAPARPAPKPTAASAQADVEPAAPTKPERRTANPSAIPPGAVTVTVNQTMAITGLGRTKVNQLMDRGVLERIKVDGRTLITVASIRRLLGQA